MMIDYRGPVRFKFQQAMWLWNSNIRLDENADKQQMDGSNSDWDMAYSSICKITAFEIQTPPAA